MDNRLDSDDLVEPKPLFDWRCAGGSHTLNKKSGSDDVDRQAAWAALEETDECHECSHYRSKHLVLCSRKWCRERLHFGSRSTLPAVRAR
jgi:hypothetical protein